MGELYGEVAGWLLDASLRAQLCSEKNEAVTNALYQAGRLSDKKLRPDLEVNFRSRSIPHGPNNTSTRAGYRHLKKSGAKCVANDEHDIVLSLVRSKLEAEFRSSIPGCRIDWLKDKRIDPSRRRPDLQARIFVDAETVHLLAIEVQKSHISIENFRARHLVLSELANKAVWLFKKNGVQGSFSPCIEWALQNKISVGSYQIEESGNLVINQILQHDAQPAKGKSVSGTPASGCSQAEDVDKSNSGKTTKSLVSLRSRVLGNLSFMKPLDLPSARLTPSTAQADGLDEFELLHVQSPLTGMDTWLGIRPWHHH